MRWAIYGTDNIVQNIIVYDGTSPLDLAPGLSIQQVNPWIKIGDLKDRAETPEEAALG